MLIWQQMEALGYVQVDGNRFVREARYVDQFKEVRTSVTNDLLGLGASSYSHVNQGNFFRNITNIQTYIASVEDGSIPIATGRVIDEEEKLAASYVVGLRTGRVESEEIKLIRALKPELSQHFQELETRLLGLGVLEKFITKGGANGLKISRLGQLFEDEILSLFYSPTVQEVLKKG